jgi:hypothetical protein
MTKETNKTNKKLFNETKEGFHYPIIEGARRPKGFT